MSETTKTSFDFLETADKIRAKRDPKQKQILIASKLTTQKNILKEIKGSNEAMDICLRNGDFESCVSINDRIFRLVLRALGLNQNAHEELYKIIDKKEV